jgi:hypothetical protein
VVIVELGEGRQEGQWAGAFDERACKHNTIITINNNSHTRLWAVGCMAPRWIFIQRNYLEMLQISNFGFCGFNFKLTKLTQPTLLVVRIMLLVTFSKKY